MALVAPQFRTRSAARTAPRLSAVLTGAGLALLPWMLVLARTLPQSAEVSNWATAWIGLDVMLAAGLTGTGLLLRRKDTRVVPVAAATAALLLMDAWFDVTTSAGSEQTLALLLAFGAELPLAMACAVVAARRA
ncbi:LPXTG cell wall anchor domain-containing protein [Streptomyces sp. NPDC059443]|uniref:LPXTG cell wall anchor domain-containing protein n=1 Tax=unclassified Streptomyces TaxID=2593676 RepID=UPI0036A8F631